MSDSELLVLQDSEKLKMVMDIVGITHVSQDQALFALHDSDFNLVLALENVMKGKPVSSAHQCLLFIYDVLPLTRRLQLAVHLVPF